MKRHLVRRLVRRATAGAVLTLTGLGAGSAVAAAPAAPGATTAVVQTASAPLTTDAAATPRVTRAVAARDGHDGDVADLLQTLVDDGALSAGERDMITADVARAAAPTGPVEPADDERLFSLQTAADVLGTDAAGLRTALAQDGATLATVATSLGVPTADLVASLTAATGEHIDLALAHDLIDAAEAADQRAELAAVVADAVQAQYVDPGRSGSDRVV